MITVSGIQGKQCASCVWIEIAPSPSLCNNLQKEVKGEIRFLQEELESMKAALEDISETPPDQVPRQDKIWARNVKELSYDIEDNIDTFMVQVKGSDLAKKMASRSSLTRPLVP